jgi:exonuclease SbcD
VHLRGVTELSPAPIPLLGKGILYPLPFIDPEAVRGLAGDEQLRGHSAATERVVSGLRAAAAAQPLPAILIAHAFVQGAAQTPDSERPIVVGNAGSVPAQVLAGFDYVALGHLHAPQEVACGMNYSGSLLKYSFAEVNHTKGVLLVEVNRGTSTARQLPLGARRDVVRLRGTLEHLLHRPELDRHRGDLVEATLEDPGYVLDARRRLQERFPHVVSVVRAELATGTAQGTFGQQVAGAGQDDRRLFEAFFATVAGAAPDAAQQAAFDEALAASDRQERGA